MRFAAKNAAVIPAMLKNLPNLRKKDNIFF